MDEKKTDSKNLGKSAERKPVTIESDERKTGWKTQQERKPAG